MTLFLSMRDADQKVFGQFNALTTTAEYRLVISDPKQQSRGYIYQLGLPSGLVILIEHYDLQEDLFVETAGFDKPALQLGFTVLGDDEPFELSQGKTYFLTYFNESFPPGLGTYYSGGQQLIYVEIFLNPCQYFNAYTSQLDMLPRSLQSYLETEDLAFLNHYRLGQTTPEMQQILQQILNCPFAGATRNLYLEDKTSELVALRLDPITSGERELERSPRLKPSDIDRLYHARAIIKYQYINPPSLLELASQVGLNDFKLKLGFKQIFGTTVFGYVWERRMQKARWWLYTGYSVQRAAMLVGYACPSRFTVAFKKRFGITPTQYLASC
jgi:AraC family transcriptional regulator, transcriptional activator of the genes for pyochelin and ferripyochelin receptors